MSITIIKLMSANSVKLACTLEQNIKKKCTFGTQSHFKKHNTVSASFNKGYIINKTNIKSIKSCTFIKICCTGKWEWTGFASSSFVTLLYLHCRLCYSRSESASDEEVSYSTAAMEADILPDPQTRDFLQHQPCF